MFSISGLRLYFPTLEPWAHSLFCSHAVPPGLSMCECGAVGSASCRTACPVAQSATSLGPPAATLLAPVLQPPPCLESSLPHCPSPPLLPVWMNASALSPWLSDFHTVQFSVSSGCFLFLNCCCPSFGCARRHSVSTYTSILAGSPSLLGFLKTLFIHLS